MGDTYGDGWNGGSWTFYSNTDGKGVAHARPSKIPRSTRIPSHPHPHIPLPIDKTHQCFRGTKSAWQTFPQPVRRDPNPAHPPPPPPTCCPALDHTDDATSSGTLSGGASGTEGLYCYSNETCYTLEINSGYYFYEITWEITTTDGTTLVSCGPHGTISAP